MTTADTPLLRDALAAFQNRDRDTAADYLRQLDAAAPPLGETWSAVSRLAITLGEASLALKAADRNLALEPNNLERRLGRDALLAHLGRLDAALKDAQALAVAHPRDARILHFLGVCLAQSGQDEKAAETFRAALALTSNPAAACWTWLALTDLRGVKITPDELSALRAMSENPGLLAHSLGTLLYALGAVLDRAGDTDAAFAAYAHGAAAIASQSPYPREAHSAMTRSVIETFTPAFLATLAPSRVDSTRPIFVLGAPRSGTTLVEQIIASHADVSGGAEINLFRTAAMALPDFRPESLTAAQGALGADVWTRIGQSYLHLLDERFGPEGRVVDKTLNHSLFVGAIKHALPQARFVWLSRDPGDNAWSCFSTRFNQGVEWSWSLTDIAARLADEERLRRHWTAIFPDAILTVPYEHLVDQPETWIDRIQRHVGLTPDPTAIDFHRTQRPVQTASAGQVRQPLYKSSVSSSQRYARQLAPFFEAYRALI